MELCRRSKRLGRCDSDGRDKVKTLNGVPQSMVDASLGSKRSGSKRSGSKRSGRTRWWVVWTLFFSTVINYISRQTFSVLAPMLTAQFHFTHTELARILG